MTVTECEEQQSRSLTIACDGGVINKYPGFKDRCQKYLDVLAQQTEYPSGVLEESERPSVSLELAPESAILGAAVAVAIGIAENGPEIQ